MWRKSGHPLQTEEVPGLQRVRQHVQSGGPGAAQEEKISGNQDGREYLYPLSPTKIFQAISPFPKGGQGDYEAPLIIS
jgi:hypothetical protein